MAGDLAETIGPYRISVVLGEERDALVGDAGAAAR